MVWNSGTSSNSEACSSSQKPKRSGENDADAHGDTCFYVGEQRPSKGMDANSRRALGDAIDVGDEGIID